VVRLHGFPKAIISGRDPCSLVNLSVLHLSSLSIGYCGFNRLSFDIILHFNPLLGLLLLCQDVAFEVSDRAYVKLHLHRQLSVVKMIALISLIILLREKALGNHSMQPNYSYSFKGYPSHTYHNKSRKNSDYMTHFMEPPTNRRSNLGRREHSSRTISLLIS
ncbi:hypothetical protein CR513_52348, partial [Mucuna pruriens]